MFAPDGRPLHVAWSYNRSEMIADGLVHAVGLALAVPATAALVILAAIRGADPLTTIAVAVYAVGLLGLLAASAAYNMWPNSPTKWRLRRLDHAAIFFLIAATYTPFCTTFADGPVGPALLAAVWIVAAIGMVVKLSLPGRFDRLSIVLCVLLGGSGAAVFDTVSASLPPTAVGLMIAGGLTYVAGIAFHLWDGLRFQNAVWHTFVLVASALFYVAILRGVVLV